MCNDIFLTLRERLSVLTHPLVMYMYNNCVKFWIFEGLRILFHALWTLIVFYSQVSLGYYFVPGE